MSTLGQIMKVNKKSPLAAVLAPEATTTSPTNRWDVSIDFSLFGVLMPKGERYLLGLSGICMG